MNKPAMHRRLRAYLQFILAVLYFFLARAVARAGAEGLANGIWLPLAWFSLIDQAMLVFLLLTGYAAMGFWFDRQLHPVSAQGLPRRAGFISEFGLGLAAGWGIAIVCVIPLAIAGGIAVVLSGRASEWGWLVADAIFFLLATLAEEIAFRGYPFQRFAAAAGPLGGAIGFSAYYAIVQQAMPGSSHASLAVSFALGLLLATAYLRTRALWVGWGLNFGWKASRALLFGLAVTGLSNHSSIVLGEPMGPFWLSGGGFGLDGAWIAFIVILAAIPLLWRLTREFDFRYNAPVLIPGGIPVDLDAAARAQHESTMGASTPALLVRIAPVGEAPASARPPELSGSPHPDPPAA